MFLLLWLFVATVVLLLECRWLLAPMLNAGSSLAVHCTAPY